ncbi:Peptidyl-prolyl isomerase cwc27 [Sparganum proliferum]
MCIVRWLDSLLTVPYGDANLDVLMDEQKFMDGDCGYTRPEVHPSVVEEVVGRPIGEADPGAFVALSVHQHGGEHKTEGGRRKDAAVFYAVGHCEFLRDSSIVRDACHHAIMELTHHLTESSGTDKSPHDIPHFVTIHPVECIRQIYERKVQVGLHLLTLYLQLVRGEDPVHGATIAAKAALTFRKNTLIQVLLQAVELNASEYLTGNVQQADASVVDDGDVFFLTPRLLEQFRHMLHELGTIVLVDLRRDRVRCGRFPAGELLHSPDSLVEREREWEVEVCVCLHLGQAGDGGVGDGGWAFQDASKLFGQSLQNLCLLNDRGFSVGAEERCSTFGGRTVDGGEEVLPFDVVRVPLDLLSLAGRLCVLHLAQPLLHEAAAMVECCFVPVFGEVVYVGFLQTAILGEQVVGGGVRDRRRPAPSTRLCPKLFSTEPFSLAATTAASAALAIGPIVWDSRIHATVEPTHHLT